MVGDAEQTIRVRGQVNANDPDAFIGDHIQKPRILMREAVVILLSDVRGQQVVQRRDLSAPR
jgi:hypothetical protein